MLSQISMNVFLMEDLDHVSKSAPTPLDPSFAAVKVAIHHLDITALVLAVHFIIIMPLQKKNC